MVGMQKGLWGVGVGQNESLKQQLPGWSACFPEFT